MTEPLLYRRNIGNNIVNQLYFNKINLKKKFELLTHAPAITRLPAHTQTHRHTETHTLSHITHSTVSQLKCS